MSQLTAPRPPPGGSLTPPQTRHRGRDGDSRPSAAAMGCSHYGHSQWRLTAWWDSFSVRPARVNTSPLRRSRYGSCSRPVAPSESVGPVAGPSFQALITGLSAWMLSDRLWAVEPTDSTPLLSALSTMVLWLVPLVALRPNRKDLVMLRSKPGAVMLSLAGVAVVPLIVYSIRQGRLATSGMPDTDTAYDLTALGVVLATQAIFAAFRPSGSTWFPRFVALAALWVGITAIIWPDDFGSLGLAWGAVLAGWGCVFAAVAEGRRRAQSSTPDERATATPKVQEASTPTADHSDGHQ